MAKIVNPSDFHQPPDDSGWQEVPLPPPPLPPVGILAGLSDQSLELISHFGRYERYDTHQIMITEGTPQNRFYILIKGRLEVFTDTAGKNITLDTLEAGDCLGEINLLDPGVASASVKVLEDSICWGMCLEELRQYISEHHGSGGALMLGVAQLLSERLRAANKLITRQAEITGAPAEIPRSSRAITAEDAPIQTGFFDKLMKSLGTTKPKKVSIPTEIKL